MSPSSSKGSDEKAKKRKANKEMKEMIEKIPVLALTNKGNKDLVKLRKDLEERARLAGKNSDGSTKEGKTETMFVDKTRNVGVVIGEKDLGKHIKKQRFESMIGMEPRMCIAMLEKVLMQAKHEYKVGCHMRGLEYARDIVIEIDEMEDRNLLTNPK